MLPKHAKIINVQTWHVYVLTYIRDHLSHTSCSKGGYNHNYQLRHVFINKILTIHDHIMGKPLWKAKWTKDEHQE